MTTGRSYRPYVGGAFAVALIGSECVVAVHRFHTRAIGQS